MKLIYIKHDKDHALISKLLNKQRINRICYPGENDKLNKLFNANVQWIEIVKGLYTWPAHVYKREVSEYGMVIRGIWIVDNISVKRNMPKKVL